MCGGLQDRGAAFFGLPTRTHAGMQGMTMMEKPGHMLN
jgi:hypothetical protein